MAPVALEFAKGTDHAPPTVSASIAILGHGLLVPQRFGGKPSSRQSASKRRALQLSPTSLDLAPFTLAKSIKSG